MNEPFPTYPKINGVFKRHPKTNRFLMDQWNTPEFGLLADCDWQWFEKVDGTNVRVRLTRDSVEFRGRTDAAQLPPRLHQSLLEIFADIGAMIEEGQLRLESGESLLLYGEGYGGNIQKGGNYRPDESFILFDVKSLHPDGRSHWLSKFEVALVADSLGLNMVPSCGVASLHQAIEIVQKGFESQLGSPVPEGVVGTPAIDLYDKYHNRIITKIKVKDFQ